VASHKPDWDAGLDKALASLPPPLPCDRAITVMACDVASFWADETNHTNPSPKFGPPARLFRDVVHDTEEQHNIPSADQYAAHLFAFAPAKDKNQIEVIVPTVPSGVEIWVNLGHGQLQAVRAGGSFDETFCRTGHVEGTYPLPPTGDVRLAITGTTKHAPPEVTVKFRTGAGCNGNGISLFHGTSVAAVFKSATCQRAILGKNQPFQATAKAGAYTLRATIKQFNGFTRIPCSTSPPTHPLS
jgi:hypothetical protein